MKNLPTYLPTYSMGEFTLEGGNTTLCMIFSVMYTIGKWPKLLYMHRGLKVSRLPIIDMILFVDMVNFS